jgi:hypothetical protein
MRDLSRVPELRRCGLTGHNLSRHKHVTGATAEDVANVHQARDPDESNGMPLIARRTSGQWSLVAGRQYFKSAATLEGDACR